MSSFFNHRKKSILKPSASKVIPKEAAKKTVSKIRPPAKKPLLATSKTRPLTATSASKAASKPQSVIEATSPSSAVSTKATTPDATQAYRPRPDTSSEPLELAQQQVTAATESRTTTTDTVHKTGEVSGSTSHRKRSAFTDSLLRKKLVTTSQISRAAVVQQITKQRIGETLSALGYLSQKDLYRNLSEIPGAPSQADLTKLEDYQLDTEFLIKYVSPEIRALRLVAANDTSNEKKSVILAVEPSVAMLTLRNLYPSSTIQHVSFSSLCKIYLQKSREYYETSFYRSAASLMQHDGANPKRFLEDLVNFSASLGASDIHIEPEGSICRVRIRVDGLLTPIAIFKSEAYAALLEVIKQACKIPAAQVNQKPIDGKFVHYVSFLSVDIRVSLIPSIKSTSLSSCVMRLLGISSEEITLEQLGMEERQVQLWRRWLRNYSGVIVISGPTGAGKTTTIYSALTEVIDPRINIVTIEDPVERHLELAKQVQVTKGVLEFDDALRAFMRHDPDIIVVGEIRDEASAKIAFEAALTGHLVITTLHANSALGIIPRLKGFGIDDLSLQEALKGLTGQRLVRCVCPHCKVKTEIPEELSGLIPGLTSQMKGTGCVHCHETGYLGRTLIAEMIPFGKTSSDMKYTTDFTALQKEVIASDKVLTLTQHAKLKIEQGETTIEEFYRVL